VSCLGCSSINEGENHDADDLSLNGNAT
jgi:hypothetical protein